MNGNGTYVLPAPGVGEGAAVEDLIVSSVDANRVGSTPGHVIVGAGVLWTCAAAYLLLSALRWLVARCYAHYLRERLFAACTDPSEAALFDVPYLNLRHASLPWLRARTYLARHRYLERRWAEIAAAHLALAVAGLTFAAGIAAARIFTSPYQDVDAALPTALAHAVVLSIALTALTTVASKCAALQEDDETLARDEKWKMTVDGERDFAVSSAMTDLADAVARRNRLAWPRVCGVRCREWVAHAAAAYTLFLVAAFLAVVAAEIAGGPYGGASADQLKEFVEVNFAYAHKFSQRLLDRVESLADNVTRVEAGVDDARVLVSTIDNVSPSVRSSGPRHGGVHGLRGAGGRDAAQAVVRGRRGGGDVRRRATSVLSKSGRVGGGVSRGGESTGVVRRSGSGGADGKGRVRQPRKPVPEQPTAAGVI